MPLASLRGRSRRRIAVNAAYHAIVTHARDPALFTAWGVPDTFDGRFEALALHAFVLLNRLKSDRARTATFAQDLFDTMFADLDRAVREMGATDVGVGRYVKAMARGFYGRIVAYEQGLTADDAALADALRRNLYGTTAAEPAQIALAARYLRSQVAALATVPITTLLEGDVPFVSAAAAAP